jgi:hypothetical protein
VAHDFLCSESGRHDQTINRREARDELGLRIEEPSQKLCELIKKIYDNIAVAGMLWRHGTPADPA